MSITLYADGGSRGNPGVAGSGFVITDVVQNQRIEGVVPLGYGTNNEAEYAGLICGLAAALKYGYQEVNIFMDSLLVVKQVSGAYQVKAENLQPFHRKAQELLRKLVSYKITHVTRSKNTEADHLSNRAMDFVSGHIQKFREKRGAFEVMRLWLATHL